MNRDHPYSTELALVCLECLRNKIVTVIEKPFEEIGTADLEKHMKEIHQLEGDREEHYIPYSEIYDAYQEYEKQRAEVMRRKLEEAIAQFNA